MDQVIVSGLHTCKPQNAPSVGQVKAFIAEDRGNYTKLRNPDRKKGEVGVFYRVIKAEKTNYNDAHGNISFNLDLEETAAPPQQQAPPPPQQGNGAPGTPQPAFNRDLAQPPQQQAYDTADQYLMRCANLYCAALKVASTVVRDAAQRMGLELSVEDIRQIATGLKMDAADHGYVAHMSDKEQRPAAPRKDPY